MPDTGPLAPQVAALPQGQREAITELIATATSPAPQVAGTTAEPDVEWPEELPQIDSGKLASSTGGNVEVATPATPAPTEVPQVAGEEQGPQLPPASIRLSVDHVRVSENTYAFRLRWSNPPGVSPKRPAIYYQWVREDVFRMITEDKESYGRYKNQIIAQFTEQQETI